MKNGKVSQRTLNIPEYSDLQHGEEDRIHNLKKKRQQDLCVHKTLKQGSRTAHKDP